MSTHMDEFYELACIWNFLVDLCHQQYRVFPNVYINLFKDTVICYWLTRTVEVFPSTNIEPQGMREEIFGFVIVAKYRLGD